MRSHINLLLRFSYHRQREKNYLNFACKSDSTSCRIIADVATENVPYPYSLSLYMVSSVLALSDKMMWRPNLLILFWGAILLIINIRFSASSRLPIKTSANELPFDCWKQTKKWFHKILLCSALLSMFVVKLVLIFSFKSSFFFSIFFRFLFWALIWNSMGWLSGEELGFWNEGSRVLIPVKSGIPFWSFRTPLCLPKSNGCTLGK